MKYRKLGSTDLTISELSFGTWAIGGDWGRVDDVTSLRALKVAIEQGVNFFDTADVYGGGHSEELLAKATKGKEDEVYIATKFCRKGNIKDPQNYSEQVVRQYCEDSLSRLKREAIDLYQIHCPDFNILQQGEVFSVLDKLKEEGKIRYYGVSVESVEEGLFCMQQPNVSALQVIFNIFRQKVATDLLPVAEQKNIGILARVPLASGLLTGKFDVNTTFESQDHRHYNANGAAFNVGETFAGLPFTKGVELANELKWIANDQRTMTQAALRWILDHSAVSSVIPGFKNEIQVITNLAALHAISFTEEEKERLQQFYHDSVHQYIRGPY